MENNTQNTQEQTNSNYSPLRLTGILSLVLFCSVLLIAATFTSVRVINILQPLINCIHPIVTSARIFPIYLYIPQVPVILFTSSLLGSACSFTSVLIYIAVGLIFLPVFGLGGGLDYIMQPSFGYIAAFLPTAILAGIIINKEHSIISIIKAVFISVISLHIIGFIYLIVFAVIQKMNFDYVLDWLIYESLVRMVYDIIFGIIAALLGKYCRRIIWILTSV